MLPHGAAASAAGESSAEDQPPGAQPRARLIAAGALALGALVAIGWSIGNDSPSPPALVAASTLDAAEVQVAGVADEAAEAPARPTVAYEAIDSRRAAATAYAAGEFDSALQALQAAVAASPEDAAAHNDLGQLFVRQGRAAEALPHFDAAVRLDDSRWNYRFNRARTYGLLDRWPDAVAEYQAAAHRLPDDHATLYNLGLAQMRVRDYAGAATSLERAVAAAPDQHDFLITLGTAYVGSAQKDRARATFERFLELAPDDADAPKVKGLLQALAESAP